MLRVDDGFCVERNVADAHRLVFARATEAAPDSMARRDVHREPLPAFARLTRECDAFGGGDVDAHAVKVRVHGPYTEHVFAPDVLVERA